MNLFRSFCLDAKRTKKIKAVFKSCDFVRNLRRRKTKLAPPASGLIRRGGLLKTASDFAKSGFE